MNDGKHPRVSIGFPIYNGEEFLSVALESLLNQSFKDFEFIISDNCSTDSTATICQHFVALDSRVIYHRNERNLGAAANFNRVVELAQGDYFAWANHDDMWAETYLERCVELLDMHPSAVLAYSRSAKIDKSGNRVAPLLDELDLAQQHPHQRLKRFHDLFRMIDRKNAWHTDEIEGLWIPIYGLIRTDCLRTTGLIGPYISSDTILLEELLMRGEFLEADACLFFKRDHPQRSMRASVSYDKRIAWFTGKVESRLLLFPRWRQLRERLKATRRSTFGRREKFHCYFEMLFFYARRPHEGKVLIKEALINAGRMFGMDVLKKKLPQKW